MFLLVLTLVGCIQTISKDDAKSKIDDAVSKEPAPAIVCGAGTALNQQTNQCVVINNGNSGSGSSSGSTTLPPSPLIPSVPNNQIGGTAPAVCREPSGVFTQLYYRQRNFVSGFLCGDACKARVLGMFRYQGNCPADIYIEAGIPNVPQNIQPLSLVPQGYLGAQRGNPSACDGNVHFNGVSFKQVQPNQIVVFELLPENYGAEGTYNLNIGAYTGCLKDGGKEVQVLQPVLVGFSNSYQVNTGLSQNNKDIDYSWVQVI